MEGHIEKRNNQVIFKNKYAGTNLESYFKLRKELLDLLIAEQHTQAIISQPLDAETKQQNLQSDTNEQKIFSEFKIKTKYMKSKVK